ncbi:unnamed protein product, partial [Ceratitis capitata]
MPELKIPINESTLSQHKQTKDGVDDDDDDAQLAVPAAAAVVAGNSARRVERCIN